MVPFIASWPGVIPRGIESDAAAMNIDFFPTFLRIAGLPLPTDRVIDGVDMRDVLTGDGRSLAPRRAAHDQGQTRVGLRSRDDFKYLARHRSDNSSYVVMKHGPFLFDLTHDPDESYDVTAHHPGDSGRPATPPRGRRPGADRQPPRLDRRLTAAGSPCRLRAPDRRGNLLVEFRLPGRTRHQVDGHLRVR